MRLIFFCLLLLLMVIICKSENNSTTTLSTSVNSTATATTVSTNASVTSTTAIPTTTTTIPSITTTSVPTTTTTPAATTTPYDESKNFDYQVCGNVTYQTDCACNNGTITCKPLAIPCYQWYCYYQETKYYPSFTSTNIKILNESFVVKIAKFYDNNLTTLKKDKVLRGNEHTVEMLQLSTNRIYSIENGTFDKFTAMKELDLGSNALKNLTAEVLTPEVGSKLEKLDISVNAFTSIYDVDFSNLVQLKFLKLYYNDLFGKNDSFSQYVFPEVLANLTTLDFGSCGIKFIGEDTFINLKSLKTLILYNNPITTFPKEIHVLPNLEYLNLDNSLIKVLNFTGFNYTMNLQKLDMLRSSLISIDDCAFCNFPELKELNLYQNLYLSYIHENAFGYAYNETAPPLESFSIEQCNLSTIPEELLNWHNVSKFGLGNNPFMCNCSMAWLINDLLSPTHSINLKDIAPQRYRYSWESRKDEFRCAAPYALKGVPFVELSRNFCPNEIKKERPVKETIVFVPETPSPLFISWFHVVVIVVTSITCLTIGMLIIPFFRYICRRRPKKLESGFLNQNFHDDLIQEDFDDEKTP